MKFTVVKFKIVLCLTCGTHVCPHRFDQPCDLLLPMVFFNPTAECCQCLCRAASCCRAHAWHRTKLADMLMKCLLDRRHTCLGALKWYNYVFYLSVAFSIGGTVACSHMQLHAPHTVTVPNATWVAGQHEPVGGVASSNSSLPPTYGPTLLAKPVRTAHHSSC